MAKAAITYEHGDNLYVNMTNKCPCRCVFCLRDDGGSIYSDNLWYDGKEPSKEEILESINSHGDLHRYHQIVFCGFGEPACRWDEMMWLCDEIKKMGPFSIRINTNGLGDLINKRQTALDLDNRVDAVSVSLNASTPEKYDEICRSAYGLDALPAILEFTTLAVLHVPHVFMTVVSTMGEEEIEACRKICNKVGAELRVREYIDNSEV